MTVVYCKWSCIVCKAVVTCSSDTCCDTGDVVAGESSHPFQEPLQPCFHQVEKTRGWALRTPGGLETVRGARQAKRRTSGLKVEKWPTGAASVAATIAFRSFEAHVIVSSSVFSRRHSSSRFFLSLATSLHALGSAACISQRCMTTERCAPCSVSLICSFSVFS